MSTKKIVIDATIYVNDKGAKHLCLRYRCGRTKETFALRNGSLVFGSGPAHLGALMEWPERGKNV